LVFSIGEDSTRSSVFDILDGRVPLEFEVGASLIMKANACCRDQRNKCYLSQYTKW